MIRSNRTEGIILMRKQGSRGCAAALIQDVDFCEFVLSSYKFVVYVALFSNEKWLLGEHIGRRDLIF